LRVGLIDGDDGGGLEEERRLRFEEEEKKLIYRCKKRHKGARLYDSLTVSCRGWHVIRQCKLTSSFILLIGLVYL
jgi:hypothetical protein